MTRALGAPYAVAVDRRRRWAVVDAALATALAGMAVLEIWVPFPSALGDGSPVLGTVLAVVLCGALAFRRRWPLASALLVLLAGPIMFSVQQVPVLFWGQLVPIVVAVYSVARYGSRRAALLGAAAATACLLYLDLRIVEFQQPSEIVFHWGLVALAWILGLLAQRAQERAAARLQAVEAARGAHTQAALAAERARIARELHDVVAHAVSVIVVQAGAAEGVVDEDPEYVRRALGAIRGTGAEALAEMRRVVSVLREPGADSADSDDDLHETGGAPGSSSLRPQPGTAALPGLIAASSAAGLPAALHVHGAERALTPGLDLAVFRIVQEALTNARRHAQASRAEVELHYRANGVFVEVRDDGRGPTGAATDGNGLIGMRERASLYGGRLETSGGPDGFVVRAEIPSGAAS